MKAVRARKPGGPEVLGLDEVPIPVPAPGEVLIDVAAAGLNRADSLQREGNYKLPDGASDVLGLEVSGTVSALGRGVTQFSVGDGVVALLTGGGYAEHVVAPAGQVLKAPAGLHIVSAAALPETMATVYSNLFMSARLVRGETVLIHGGAGGIGTTAIQLVKALGGNVAVTAGSQEKLAAAAALGADILINYKEKDFVAEIKAATAGRGADVILDVVGADYLSRNIDALNFSGRLVIIGLQGGARTEFDIRSLMAKRASVIGTLLRPRPVEEKTAIMAALAEHVWPLVAAGMIEVPISRTFPLAEAAAAHRYFDSGTHIGKVLLTV
ncbi:NAD(P)H-quinone oxidoreductase [Pseudarthrobacter sp. MDT3-26]|uniref:NAD(P)H-quinone oxidoreductase n=1 Tax=Pseudarthrobacter raffinosi TaxID=2953651 RepID=UPI00208E1F27|nr:MULTISPECIES: NAD(P)H-quinone oxidoreductase [unclassified Pseudarthrobacter]MCO4238893.1 NAD(P)H-quinone oxidoreductase [Pseudarthrobacter sp. MDT3-28]MCO4264849.1 NAD(P)H-quinone oxidoreductase [Pseudarthrobacter sp. MDT3-26]